MHEMKDQPVPKRRSCEPIAIWRSSCRYQPVVRDDGGLAAKLHEIAAEDATAGYRTAWAYLRQDGILVNHKRVQRVCKEEALTQPSRRGASRPREDPYPFRQPTPTMCGPTISSTTEQRMDSRSDF